MSRDDQCHLQPPTTLVEHAPQALLLVHPYIFHNEHFRLAADHQRGNPASPVFPHAAGDAAAKHELFYRLGVDGVFSDNPDTAVAVRRAGRGR